MSKNKFEIPDDEYLNLFDDEEINEFDRPEIGWPGIIILIMITISAAVISVGFVHMLFSIFSK